MVDYKAIDAQIRRVYLGNKAPWVIGFSGGKDSTAVLQMVFYSLSSLPKTKLTKPIHVVSNDTLVENPAVRDRVDGELRRIRRAGKTTLFRHNPDLFVVAKLKPKLDDTFWVNVIGKGYPSPNRWFRWCTERLKIRPTSEYIKKKTSRHGKVIIVLGTRKAESANRAASMKSRETGRLLRKHTLPNALVYAPIAELTNNEVWAYLLQAPSPWKANNRDLLALYQDACDAGECPFVIETGTQSCGKSRFGCWVCTVVDRDRSMENFIENGHRWMERLLAFRNWLHDIRQQDGQNIPRQHRGRDIRFGAFLVRTRTQIFSRLLRMQGALPVTLVGDAEARYVRKLLRHDAGAGSTNGMRSSLLRLRNGMKLAITSDFDVLASGRRRLGPYPLSGAEILGTRRLSGRYAGVTRLIYHVV